MGIPVIMAGDHERAGRYVSRLIVHRGPAAMEGTRALVLPIVTAAPENAVAEVGVE